MKNKNPIIYAPERQNRVRYWAERIVSVLLTLAVWFFLLQYIYNQLFAAELAAKTTDIMEFLGLAVLIVLAVEGGWQFYNWFLYHGKERRKEFPQQPLEEVGKLYGISGERMEDLQQIQRVAVVLYDDNRYYYSIEGKELIEIVTLREEK